MREIKEETGITANILDGFLNKIEYAMKNGNIKQTTYFCAKYENRTIKYNEHELLCVNYCRLIKRYGHYYIKISNMY